MLNNVFDGYNVTIFAYGQTVCECLLFNELVFLFLSRVQEKHLL
jgi:hypothetical protein